MTAQPSLFDGPTQTIWRKPGLGEFPCTVCGSAACFCEAQPMRPVPVWYCRRHVPADFLPKGRING